MKDLTRKIRQILNIKKMKKQGRNVFTAFACIVVFVTTYALILPAITLEKDALICGMEVHEHTDSCYEDVLICSLPEGDDHTHDASCYEQQMTCGMEAHVHTQNCYEKNKS